MATVTKGRTFVSGEVVTPTKLNALVDSATVTNIVTADISDAQITTAKIADSSVTTAKIADGAITGTKLNSSVILVPTGAVMPFAMNSAPTGWLAADGAAVSRSLYSALFAAIGTLYGAGDGSTSFNLPDLRASFVRGAGSDGVATAGAFGAKQADDFRSHTHGVNDPGHNHTVPAVSGGGGVWSAMLQQSWASMATSTNTTGISIQFNGGTETRPRNIAMLYCIKF